MTIKAVIHRATIADISIIAGQRAAMFVAMGSATPDIVDQLVAEAEVYLRSAIPREKYLGWLACPAAAPEQAVAGAGVQIRRVLPFPRQLPDGQSLYEKLGFAMSNEMRFMGDLGGFGDRGVDAETSAS